MNILLRALHEMNIDWTVSGLLSSHTMNIPYILMPNEIPDLRCCCTSLFKLEEPPSFNSQFSSFAVFNSPRYHLSFFKIYS